MSKFTEDEKTITRNINKKYKWIARNKSGSLVIFTRKPIKREKSWCVDRIDELNSITEFEHIFKSIRWEDDNPVLIKDIYDPQIISDKEREYLKNILKPFHDDVKYVEKRRGANAHFDKNTHDQEFLLISLENGAFIFPDFDEGKMYSGMEVDKKYELHELGITYTEEK